MQKGKLKTGDLPTGTPKLPVEYPHFPTRWQAFVWRNWELIPPARIAAVLQCSENDVLDAAAEMGLIPNPQVNPKWLSHGYLTLIRNNWHLLPYAQLLELLDWTPEKMAYTLKEEDFFPVKMNRIRHRLIKPYEKKINSLLAETPTLSGTQLYQRLKKYGFTGSVDVVRRYLSHTRPENAQNVSGAFL